MPYLVVVAARKDILTDDPNRLEHLPPVAKEFGDRGTVGCELLHEVINQR